MKYLFISSKVESRIEALKKAGKAGATLARKATRIVDSLASGTIRHHMDSIGSYTKYGEKRIKNCRKFDLGCGYRLITLQHELHVFIPFLGTHDECQRWLENNSRLKEVIAGNGSLVKISAPEKSPKDLPAGVSVDLSDDTENELLLNVRDKDLRRIFSGLVEGPKKRRRQSCGYPDQHT
jgi:hypothetical protein